PVSAQPPVATPVQPAPVNLAPAQAAVLVQQAAQQGDALAALPSGSAPMSPDAEAPPSVTPPVGK
ncbi:hypothetical protein ACLESD_13495, partial [Pyxidicoccus sp. 3LFB2]